MLNEKPVEKSEKWSSLCARANRSSRIRVPDRITILPRSEIGTRLFVPTAIVAT